MDRILLGSEPHEWEIVDVDSDDEIARRWSDSIPVLFVNGRLFAKVRIPAARGAAAPDAGGRRRGAGRGVTGTALRRRSSPPRSRAQPTRAATPESSSRN